MEHVWFRDCRYTGSHRKIHFQNRISKEYLYHVKVEAQDAISTESNDETEFDIVKSNSNVSFHIDELDSYRQAWVDGLRTTFAGNFG